MNKRFVIISTSIFSMLIIFSFLFHFIESDSNSKRARLKSKLHKKEYRGVSSVDSQKNNTQVVNRSPGNEIAQNNLDINAMKKIRIERLLTVPKRRLVKNEKSVENNFSYILEHYPRESVPFLKYSSTDRWSLFERLQIRKKIDSDNNDDELFSIGPYAIYENKIETESKNQISGLLFNEDQKFFAVLTGRIILKLQADVDEDEVSANYNLEKTSEIKETRTFIYIPREQIKLGKTLEDFKKDSRIVRYQFEVVNNLWSKN